MKPATSTGKRGSRKIGRYKRKQTNKGYPARRLKTKIKHVLRSSGQKAADAYRLRYKPKESP